MTKLELSCETVPKAWTGFDKPMSPIFSIEIAANENLKFWGLWVVPFLMFLKVSRNIDLVYGGGSIGLMGLVSQAVHNGGRHVLG